MIDSSAVFAADDRVVVFLLGLVRMGFWFFLSGVCRLRVVWGVAHCGPFYFMGAVRRFRL